MKKKNKKRVKIVNKFRFVVSLSFILVLAFTMVSSIFLSGNKVEGYQEDEYIEIYVDYGDTIWDLSRKNSPKNKDIRKSIYEISQINNLNTYDIYPGQILKIPK